MPFDRNRTHLFPIQPDPAFLLQRDSDRIIQERVNAGAYRSSPEGTCPLYEPLSSTEGKCPLTRRIVNLYGGCTNPEKCEDYLHRKI